jgi:hypothetical protein
MIVESPVKLAAASGGSALSRYAARSRHEQASHFHLRRGARASRRRSGYRSAVGEAKGESVSCGNYMASIAAQPGFGLRTMTDICLRIFFPCRTRSSHRRF